MRIELLDRKELQFFIKMNPSFNPSFQPDYVMATAVPVSAPPSKGPPAINEAGAREYLTSCKWPTGLQDTFLRNLDKIPIRFFICDDSGSMSTEDGHRLIQASSGKQSFIKCTRWAELTSALSFHATIAKAANAPSQFRLLNGSTPITIGDGTDYDGSRYRLFMNLLQQSPSGGTPLCSHIRDVIEQIRVLAPELRAKGQKACVIIASDGESSDGDVAQALKPLEHLPAWVVIRLCTDEERIVNYWNNIDDNLELEMDVLDDLEGEAEEIREHNSWLTYCEPLHRIREFGIPVKELDLLDEKALNLDQIRLFCALLFGGSPDSYPHPQVDNAEFKAMIKTQMNKTGKVFDPISKTQSPWINLSKVKGGSGCVLL